MRRVHQIIFIVATLLGSWMGMEAIHESGHVLAGLVTGGHVERVVLNPLAFSRTDLTVNPHPLLVVWAGPVFGALVPVLIWAIAGAMRLSGAFVLRFFAGFCLLANGLYIGVGSFTEVGDCGVMLSHGSAMWQLWLFGAMPAPAGLWLWHRQGRYFGLGRGGAEVKRGMAYAALGICLALLALGFIVDGR